MIVLKGNPISTNNIYKITSKGGKIRTYMTKKGEKLKNDYYYQGYDQWGKPPLEGDIALNIILYFGDKEKRDIDNYNKILLDSLTGVLWEDDKQITEMHIFKEYDKKDPRIEVTVL